MEEARDELEAIIAGCKRGDSTSFSRFIDAYAARVYGFFYRLSGNRSVSDDLSSELFVKLVSRIKQWRGGNFDGWLFTVASNIWRDRLRAMQRDERMLERRSEQMQREAQLQRHSSSEAEAVDRLGAELARIDEDSRELIVLRYYSGMSFREIAEARSMPIGTVLSKVHRGLKRLRQSMERQDNE
jgi:RNA polymerase sigma-70 factor (ECF subfamily)